MIEVVLTGERVQHGLAPGSARPRPFRAGRNQPEYSAGTARAGPAGSGSIKRPILAKNQTAMGIGSIRRESVKHLLRPLAPRCGGGCKLENRAPALASRKPAAKRHAVQRSIIAADEPAPGSNSIAVAVRKVVQYPFRPTAARR
jgi:hypothetical protein